jgi:predicted RNA-binding protein (virulence factor B family)
MKILEKNSGVLNYGLKSTPEEIKNIFDLSKKSFKTSVLALKVDNEIELFDYLIKIK